MKKFLAIIVCYGSAFAMDKPLPLSTWYAGLGIECVYTPTVGFDRANLCTDWDFTKKFEQIGLSLRESIEVQNLPKLKYTLLPLSESKDPSFSLSDWCFVGKGEAAVLLHQSKLINTKNCNILATHWLTDCVGIAIISPQITFFAHIQESDVIDNEIIYNVTNLMEMEQRVTAKVFLVSSCYSHVFSKVYRMLQKVGFHNIFADIEPVILTHSNNGSLDRYIKATSLETYLPIYEHADPIIFQNNSHKYFPLPGTKVLIIDAKAAEIYCLKYKNERHLETQIIDNWIRKYNLRNNFSYRRFDLQFFKNLK